MIIRKNQKWGFKTNELTNSVRSSLCTLFLSRMGDMAPEIGGLIERGDYRAIVEYPVSYAKSYDSIGQLIAVRQLLALFQKDEDLELLGVDKKARAYEKFLDSERKCDLADSRIRPFVNGRPNEASFHEYVLLDAARVKIRSVLGSAPRISDLRLRFGPGATTGTKKQFAAPCYKFAEGLACSERLYASGLLPSALREVPHWTAAFAEKYSVDDDGYLCETVPVHVSCGKVSFVPKNALTYRSIGVEPNLNMMLQLGIGSYITHRLKRIGLDLTKQEPNQVLARRGSLTGEYSTLDLSSASDSISVQLVRFLLPEDWYFLLDSTRTSSYLLDGEVLHLSKFCSMGNGFTFPLETLIFWSLCWAVTHTFNQVYGDDIIVLTEYAQPVIDLLAFCGFETNVQKTFVSGPFRESCGADYYKGFNIRPVYIRENVSLQSLFILHNYFIRSYDHEAAAVVRAYIPKDHLLFGPDGFGDGHLIGEWVPFRPAKLQKKGFGGFQFETYVFDKTTVLTPFPGDWVSPLYQIYVAAGKQPVVVNGLPLISSYTPHGVDGRARWTVPGRGHVKRMKIYTFKDD